MHSIDEERWLGLLVPAERQLAQVSFALYHREIELQKVDGYAPLPDYSFIVFDMAKAYEGFLKRYFFELNLIDKGTYESKRFRLGRALNPDIHQDQRDRYWLFDDVAHLCGETIARQMWSTWLESRNRVFHFFPDESPALNFEAAGKKLEEIGQTIETAVMCDRAHNYFSPH